MGTGAGAGIGKGGTFGCAIIGPDSPGIRFGGFTGVGKGVGKGVGTGMGACFTGAFTAGAGLIIAGFIGGIIISGNAGSRLPIVNLLKSTIRKLLENVVAVQWG